MPHNILHTASGSSHHCHGLRIKLSGQCEVGKCLELLDIGGQPWGWDQRWGFLCISRIQVHVAIFHEVNLQNFVNELITALVLYWISCKRRKEKSSCLEFLNFSLIDFLRWSATLLPTEKRKQTESANVFKLTLSSRNRCNKMDYHRLCETLFIFFGCLRKSEPIDLLCYESQQEKYWKSTWPQLAHIHNFSYDNSLLMPWSSSFRGRWFLRWAKLCASLGGRWHTGGSVAALGKQRGKPLSRGTDAS